MTVHGAPLKPLRSRTSRKTTTHSVHSSPTGSSCCKGVMHRAQAPLYGDTVTQLVKVYVVVSPRPPTGSMWP